MMTYLFLNIQSNTLVWHLSVWLTRRWELDLYRASTYCDVRVLCKIGKQDVDRVAATLFPDVFYFSKYNIKPDFLKSHLQVLISGNLNFIWHLTTFNLNTFTLIHGKKTNDINVHVIICSNLLFQKSK